MKKCFRILFFPFLCFSLTGLSFTIDTTNKDSLKVVFLDDPVVAKFDSMLLANFTNSESIFEGSVTSSTEVPSYSDSIYTLRIEALNKKTPIDLVFNPYVKQYIKVYTQRRRTQMSRMMGLAAFYFPMFEEVLDQFDLPLELKYLAIVESALNPRAKSWAGATGLWQFMYNTGKEYDLKISSYVDERMDPYRATVAACMYFQSSYNLYKDWSLVLASYNSGRGNVNKAIRRSGGHKNYWKIRRFLPKETRSYVPAFIAVCYAMNYADKHSISPEEPKVLHYEIDTIEVKYQIDFQHLSKVLDISI